MLWKRCALFSERASCWSSWTAMLQRSDKSTSLPVLNNKTCAGLRIEQMVDRRAATDGGDFVVKATAIDRNRLWKLDYEVPRKYGIRQTLGENGWPGGLFFTLRADAAGLRLIRPARLHQMILSRRFSGAHAIDVLGGYRHARPPVRVAPIPITAGKFRALAVTTNADALTQPRLAPRSGQWR